MAKESTALRAGCWSGTAFTRRHLAFWNASWAEAVHSQHFGSSLQEIGRRFQNLSPVWQKTAVKVYHAKKMLKLFDILRGWAIFYFGNMIGRGGRSRRKMVCPRISREGAAKTHFSKLMARLLGPGLRSRPEPKLLAGAGAGILKFRLRLPAPAPGQIKVVYLIIIHIE